MLQGPPSITQDHIVRRLPAARRRPVTYPDMSVWSGRRSEAHCHPQSGTLGNLFFANRREENYAKYNECALAGLVVLAAIASVAVLRALRCRRNQVQIPSRTPSRR